MGSPPLVRKGLDQLREGLYAGADILLLDNFTPESLIEEIYSLLSVASGVKNALCREQLLQMSVALRS
ncbi:MAG TPA: hypothetical protein VIR60_10555 [Gammaproteobacteria bacterium]